MLFYSTIFAMVALLAIANELILKYRRDRNFVVFIMFVILCIVSAFHGIGGTDYDIYKAAYKRVCNVNDVLANPIQAKMEIFNFELGYILFISIIKQLGFSFGGYIIIQSILFYSLLYCGLRKFTTHWGLVLLVFMYKMLFYDTFISMRQPLTIAGFFLILKYIYKGETLKYFVGALLLAFIHNGAFILIPLYCVRFFKITQKRIIMLSILFFPTMILAQLGRGATINSVMMLINGSKGESYSAVSQGFSIAYALEYYLLLVAVIFNYKKIIKIEYSEFILKFFLVVLPIVTLFSGVIILRRELDYFFPFYGIVGGYLCDDIKTKRILITFIFILVSYYGYTRYLSNFDNGGLIPYKTWMQTAK